MGRPPHTIDHILFKLLQDENMEEFNAYREAGHECDLTGAHLRGLDLRGMNADGLDLTDVYFRGADLSGIDFRKANLVGASIGDAKISGTYFPDQLSADEIRLSLDFGTRLRYTPSDSAE